MGIWFRVNVVAKTTDVRAEKSGKNGAGNSNSGKKENDDDEGQSKMHLQTKMAIQEICLTRRARKTARKKMDRYKMNQAKLTCF